MSVHFRGRICKTLLYNLLKKLVGKIFSNTNKCAHGFSLIITSNKHKKALSYVATKFTLLRSTYLTAISNSMNL